MSNAAIYYHPDAFDTAKPELKGRQAAGEGFLRGFLRHAEVDQFYFANWYGQRPEVAEALVRRIEPISKPIHWLFRTEAARVSEPGCLFISSPANAQEAWMRRLIGPTAYSICGLTHTTATERVMDTLIDMLQAPVEPWDALICTSRAVKQSVATQQAMAMDYLRERFGPIVEPVIRLETIPLGINSEEFTRSEPDRARLRRELGIDDDDIAVLYVGRFSPHAKMNPVPMAMALERAAQRTRRKLHWILAGWASDPDQHDAFTGAGRRFAPSIETHVLDGRLPEVRVPVWSAGDIFFSLSDNIQETFGLTPVEAMAAGLPAVISDWDGYRDLIEHGVQGFRVPSFAPEPGGAVDLAMAYGNRWMSYDAYVGSVSQYVSIDLDQAAAALLQLIENDDLRLRMGAAGQARARTVFDWKTVIGQYQALWSELAAVRGAARPKSRGGLSPWRPDPFTLFAAYPTRSLGPDVVATMSPDASLAIVERLLADPTIAFSAVNLLRAPEFAALLAILETRRTVLVEELVAVLPPVRRGVARRSVLWLAKYGLAALSPRPQLSDS